MDELRSKVDHLTYRANAMVVLMAASIIFNIAMLVVFVRTDTFRKEQNKSVTANVGANTEAILAIDSNLTEAATVARQERAKMLEIGQKERAIIRTEIDELEKAVEADQ